MQQTPEQASHDSRPSFQGDTLTQILLLCSFHWHCYQSKSGCSPTQNPITDNGLGSGVGKYLFIKAVVAREEEPCP